jgi:hypothetical protein
MRSISSATWLSLAIGWLTAAAAVAVVAVAPDEAPGVVLVPAQSPASAPLQHDAAKVPAGFVGPHAALVTLSSEFVR